MSKEQIYWDSDPFLGWLQEEEGKFDLCQGTIKHAEDGNVLIVTSALTLAEVLYQKRKEVIPIEKKDKVVQLFQNEFIAVRNVTRAIAEAARELVWSNGIAPKDAIHVATAVLLKLPILETFDKDLIDQSGNVGDPPLTIRAPIKPPQGALDL
jgi:predicted nucleic acid-binding protein